MKLQFQPRLSSHSEQFISLPEQGNYLILFLIPSDFLSTDNLKGPLRNLISKCISKKKKEWRRKYRRIYVKIFIFFIYSYIYNVKYILNNLDIYKKKFNAGERAKIRKFYNNPVFWNFTLILLFLIHELNLPREEIYEIRKVLIIIFRWLFNKCYDIEFRVSARNYEI